MMKPCLLKRGAHLAQCGISMAVIRDLLGHHSVMLTEKYYPHLAPSNLSAAVRQLEGALASPKIFTEFFTQLHQEWAIGFGQSEKSEAVH
jgi:hypothetical protein